MRLFSGAQEIYDHQQFDFAQSFVRNIPATSIQAHERIS